MDLVWQAFVRETFEINHDRHTEAHARQQKLALALPSQESDAVTADKSTDLSPELTRAYALAGPRTPARDLNALAKLDLARIIGTRCKRKYRANREVLQRFVPPVSS